MNQKTAILIFANSAQQEGVSKSFYKSTELFNELNIQAVETVKKTKLPFFIVDENQQIGNTFAERFKNALQNTFDKGYENIIAIGNDTPELNTKHLLEASQSLQENKTVIGPSTDGGFYLLGIQKSAFEKISFLELPWKTSKLYKSITELFSNLTIETHVLNVLRDIDSIADAKTIYNQFKKVKSSIQIILKKYFEYSRKILKTPLVLQKSTILQNYFNKGSPLQNLSFSL